MDYDDDDNDEEWQQFRHEIRSEFTRQTTLPSLSSCTNVDTLVTSLP